MEWLITPNKRLLFWPGALVMVLNSLVFFSQIHFVSQLLVLIVTLIWAYSYSRKNILLVAKNAVMAIRYLNGEFTIGVRSSHKNNAAKNLPLKWIKVEPVSGSLVSYWLVALKWKMRLRIVAKKRSAQGMKAKYYSTIITPGMLTNNCFRDLLRTLHQYQPLKDKSMDSVNSVPPE